MRRKIEICEVMREEEQDPTLAATTAAAKLAVAKDLHQLGVGMVEVGWPGAASPATNEFFAKLKPEELGLYPTLSVFGATVRAKYVDNPEQDPSLKALIASGAGVVTVFGKVTQWQAEKILGVTPEQNLTMIRNTVKWLKDQGVRVIFDAEHAVEGWLGNAHYGRASDERYVVQCLQEAKYAGADTIVLCDTNGVGNYWQIEEIFRILQGKDWGRSVRLGIHCHNDRGLAVANTLAAVRAGATHVQVTVNGIGERTGNAALEQVVLGLEEMGYDTGVKLDQLVPLCCEICDILGREVDPQSPIIGEYAFSHKAGVHAAAVAKYPQSYEGFPPELVGAKRTTPLSACSGANALAQALGITLEKAKEFLSRFKEWCTAGNEPNHARASLLLFYEHESNGQLTSLLETESVHVSSRFPVIGLDEAVIRAQVDEKDLHMVADSNQGPIHALQLALVKCLPGIEAYKLLHYRVDNLDSGTEARVRVTITFSHEGVEWTTCGVERDSIRASYEALLDGAEYFLRHILKQAA